MRKDNLAGCSKTEEIGKTNNSGLFENWKTDLEKASKDHSMATISTDQTKKAYKNAKSWESQLKTYLQNVKMTSGLSEAVLGHLLTLNEQAEEQGRNTTTTLRAAKKLYEMILAGFYHLDLLQNEVNDLLDEITSLNNPKISFKSSTVVKYLEEFKASVKVSLELETSTILGMVKALESHHVINEAANSSTAHCSENDEQGTGCGLIDILEDLIDRFQVRADSRPIPLQKPGVEENLAHPKCPLPKAIVPIKGNDYYNDIESNLEAAEKQTKDAKDRYNELKKDLDHLESFKDNLTDAIAAALEAGGGEDEANDVKEKEKLKSEQRAKKLEEKKQARINQLEAKLKELEAIAKEASNEARRLSYQAKNAEDAKKKRLFSEINALKDKTKKMREHAKLISTEIKDLKSGK